MLSPSRSTLGFVSGRLDHQFLWSFEKIYNRMKRRKKRTEQQGCRRQYPVSQSTPEQFVLKTMELSSGIGVGVSS